MFSAAGGFVNDWSSTLFHHYNVIGQKVNHDKLIFYSQIDSKYLKIFTCCATPLLSSSRCRWLRGGEFLHEMNIEINLRVFKLYKMYQRKKVSTLMGTFDDNTHINAL